MVEDLRPKWGALFPSFGLYPGFWIGEFWLRTTRADTSCRSLLGESDRLWGMISGAHFRARATLGARGKLGKTSLFFVTKSDGVLSVGKGERLRRGGRPARRGGPTWRVASRRWIYLGGGWAVPDACGLGLGRTVGHGPYRGGLLWGGPWDTVPTGVGLTGAARGWVARGRRVGGPRTDS